MRAMTVWSNLSFFLSFSLQYSFVFISVGYGLVSGAGSSSSTYGNGGLARSNAGYGSQNSVPAAAYSAPIVSAPAAVSYSNSGDDSSQDDTDDGSDNSGPSTGNIRTFNVGAGGAGVLAGAQSSSASGQFNRGSNVGAFGIGTDGGGSSGAYMGNAAGNNGYQYVRIGSNSGSSLAQDMNSQIQATIQDILRRFGITMQQNYAGAAGASLYQPGQSFIVRSNGVPSQYQSQGQSQYGSGAQSQYQSSSGNGGFGGQNQQAVFSASAPVVIRYQLVGNPGQTNSGLAFSVQNQGVSGGYGGGASAGASASNVDLQLGGGNSGSVSYSGNLQPVVTSYGGNSVDVSANNVGYGTGSGASQSQQQSQQQQQQQQQPAQDNSQDGGDDSDSSSGGGYAAAPVAAVKSAKSSVYGGSGGYAAPPAPAPVSVNRVRYAANSQKKSESSSNVAYEQDSSSS